MKLFADENVARAIVLWLRGRGHEVLYAAEEEPGAPDDRWLERCEADSRCILTSDKDFGELVFRDRLSSHGIILLRLEDLRLSDRLARMESAWPVVEENPKGKLIVISGRKIRVRDLRS